MSKADELLRKAVGALHGVENYSLLRSQILDYLDTPKKPMTEEEIGAWLDGLDCDEDYCVTFYAGIRFAEKHHEIGERNEQ